jgi:LmbE family N-acetylglucosaminyl deacetylase
VQVAAVTAVIRLLRPRWIACAPEPRRHPDHAATAALVAKAGFMANLPGYKIELPPLQAWPEAVAGKMADRWQAEAIFEVCPVGEKASLIFDCTRTWEAKRQALARYRSQFRREPNRVPTLINAETWFEEIDRRGAYWGFRAGVGYGEALRSEAAVVLSDISGENWS